MGTFTQKYSAQEITPTYNPVVFTAEYTAPTESGFKWLGKITVDGDTTYYKKQPVSGTDIFFDFSHILQSYVSDDFNPELTGFTNTPNSINKYNVQLGYTTDAVSDTYTNYGDYYVIGAALNRNDFNSYHFEDYEMKPEAPYTATTSPTYGKFLTKFSERSVRLTDYGTLSFLNGSGAGIESQPQFIFININGRNYYIENPYIGSSTETEQRCEVGIYPQNIEDYITSNGYIYWQTYSDPLTILSIVDANVISPTYSGKIVIYITGNQEDIVNSIGENVDITGTVGYDGTYDILAAGSGYIVADTSYIANDGGGTANVYTRKNIDPIFTSSISSYEVWAQYVGQKVSPTYTFNIDTKSAFGGCRTNGDLDLGEVELAWINDLGSYEYFTFTMKNKTTIDVNRDTYVKKLGTLDNAVWGYNNSDFEESVYVNYNNTKYTLTSDWIKSYDNNRLVELITSSKLLANIKGIWTPVILETDSMDVMTNKNNKTFNYTFKIRTAYNNKKQKY